MKYFLSLFKERHHFLHWNDYFQYYIVLFYYENAIVLGPLLYEKLNTISKKDFVNKFKNGWNLTKVKEYYSRLPVVSKEKQQYFLKIIHSTIINKENLVNINITPESNTPNPSIKNIAYNPEVLNKLYKMVVLLADAIEDGSYERFVRTIYANNAIIKQDILNNDYTINSIKSYITKSISKFSNAAIKGGLSSSKANEFFLNYVNTINSMNTPKDIFYFTLDKIKKLCELITINNLSNHSILITQAIIYINDNLYTAIEPIDVSNHCDVSRKYLGNVFKKETGDTLNDFINKAKTEKATKFIKDFQYPLIDVSTMLGFKDYSNFSKIFKKFKNATPEDISNNFDYII